MNILFITHQFYPAVGGTEANAEFLAQAFHQHGFNIHLITWTTQKGTKQFPYLVIRHPNLGILINEHNWADVVFENSPVLRLSWPAIFFRKPLIVVLNTWLSNEDGSRSVAARAKYIWLKKAAKVVAVSKAIKKKCWPCATVIENAYDDVLFKNTVDWKLRPKAFVFLGRLVSDKGADMAIRAIGKLKDAYLKLGVALTDTSLTIIGEGKDSEGLKALVKEMGLDEIVSFKGSLSGQPLVDTLNQHKFMLVPSKWEEPFGIVALEGLASGCIPIVSDGGGLPEAVGPAGLIFKKGDVDDMVSSITRLLNDTNLQCTLRSAADHHLMAHSKTTIANRYFEVINAVAYKTKI